MNDIIFRFLLKGGFEKARPSWDSSFISIRKVKIFKAEIHFSKVIETCIKEQDVNAMYRKIMKMKIDMGKLKNIASEPGQQPVFATWLIPVRKVLSL